jgi:hypothetical protein
MSDHDLSLNLAPLCLTNIVDDGNIFGVFSITNFECSHLNSQIISDNIIKYFIDNHFDYIMPSMSKHHYVFSRNGFVVECSLYQINPINLNEIIVDFCRLQGTSNDFSQMFKEIKQMHDKPHDHGVFTFTSLSALDCILTMF